MFDSVWGVIPPRPPERNTAWNKGRKCFHCLGAPNNLIRPWAHRRSSLTSSIDGRQWSASWSCRFTQRKTGVWQSCSGHKHQDKNFIPQSGPEPWSSRPMSITMTQLSRQMLFTRWFKYDRDWSVCKQAALCSSCATLRQWSHNLHPPSCSVRTCSVLSGSCVYRALCARYTRLTGHNMQP